MHIARYLYNGSVPNEEQRNGRAATMIRNNAATILMDIVVVIITVVIVAAGMAYGSAARDARCSVPISELSWIGAAECDRLTEWIDAAE